MKIFLYLINILSIFNFNSSFKQEQVTSVSKKAESVISISKDAYVTTMKNSSYLSYEDIEYHLNDVVISKGLDTINNIYLLCNNENDIEIFIFNKFNKNISSKKFENLFIENIYDFDNSLYLIGSSCNNGLIYHLTYDLNLVEERIFYSDGLIRINNLIKDNNYFYISIYKDGITNNSEFISHGNNLEIKSLIVKLDLDFNIINTYYINENKCSEIVKNLYIFNDKIKLLLKTNENYYVYNLSLNLDNLKYYIINSNNDLELLINYKNINEDLIINKTLNKLSLTSNNNINDIYQISNFNQLLDYKHIGSNLYLYGLNDQLIIHKLSEYEILKEEPKVLNYFNLNYLDTSNIKVESLLGNVDVIIDSVTPYFDKTISGEYEITYKIMQEDVELTKITVPLIVEDYTNFYDYGIYQVNKTLEFFGTATLNNSLIYYGMSITEPGEYDIEITNINGEKKNYHIYIVDNYYKDEIIINTNSIEIVDNKAIINLNLNNLKIKEIIINGKTYPYYQVIDDTLVIEFNKANKSVESYFFNGITFINNDEEFFYDINKQFTFNYLKIPPNMVLNKTLETTLLKIDCITEDLEKTFTNLLIESDNTKDVVYDNKTITTNNVKVYIVYDLGNGIKNNILLCEVKQNKIFKLDINCIYDSGSLKNIKINIDIDKDELNTLNICDASLLDFYKKINNSNYLKSIIIISVTIFISLGVIFIGYIIIKKKKHNTF